MINCLMSTGHPITPDVADYLLHKARKMARDKQSSLRLKGKVCWGKLTTEWKYVTMGPLAGMQFKAEIEFEHGETVVTFIVREFDLDAGGDWGYADSATVEHMAQLDALEERPHPSRLN